MINTGGQGAESGSRVRAAHRAAALVVLSLAGSIVLYMAVGYIIATTAQPKTEPTQVPIPFYVAAVFLALGSIAFRRTQMHRFRLESVAIRRGPEGLIKHLFTATLISAALAEVIGLLGLVTVFFGGDAWDVVRLCVVALAITLYNYPRRAAWQQTVDYFSATLPK
jgi:hypothetical protein